ncbi:MAG: HAD-IIB family hydrolase [Planctomycetaceae bacterium]|nr:HAD-IIB family hydrolase [Planctomycetaceae bacterium]
MTGVLATDLDGTLIPLDGESRQQADLIELTERLRTHEVLLVYVTGRHLESIEHVRRLHPLPRPNWIVSDVGTTLYRCDGTAPTLVPEYAAHLRSITGATTTQQLQLLLRGISGLRLQEDEKQGEFKLSFYVEAGRLRDITEEIEQLLAKQKAPYSLIHSVDPFNGDGLIDLLPRGVSKAHALHWWAEYTATPLQQLVFAGDSGNDLAVLTSGCRSVLVGNASRALADQVQAIHAAHGWHDRLYLPPEHATSGVLAGCQHFGLLPKAM